MAEKNQSNATESTTPEAGKSGARAPRADAAPGSPERGSNPPRPAVKQQGGDGHPEVDTLSFDPEDSDFLAQTRRWIEQNPALAIAGAAAAGLIIGRVVAALIPEPEPQTFSEKVEARARELAKQGRYVASDAGEIAAQQLAIAADALQEASKAVGKGAKRGFEEAKDFSAYVSEAVGQALAEKASNWLEKR